MKTHSTALILGIVTLSAVVWFEVGAERSPITAYVAPRGDDSNPGTLEAPWGTLQYAIRQLGPGDTLYLRGGTYLESSITVEVAGTPDAPITIRNHPGEEPVVDGGYAEFRQPGNLDWEVHDADKGIYRSAKTYPDADRVFGYLGPADGSFGLVPYADFGPLGTDNEEYAETPPYYYIGPGVFWNADDTKIYVRLRHSKYQAKMGLDVPADTDPRRIALYLFPQGRVLDFRETAAHLVIEGIRFRFRDNALHFATDSNHITVRRCEALGGRYHILVRRAAHHLTFDQVSIRGRFPPWVAWTDVKRPSAGRPGHLLQGTGINFGDWVDTVEIKNGTFTGLFDAIGAGKAPRNLHVHHNRFDTIRDDVVEIGSAGYEFEFDHNTILNAAAGVSWSGWGSPPVEKIGTKYIHHNIIDTSVPQLYGRSDPLDLMDAKYRGPDGDGMGSGRAFGMHGKDKITGPDPWKIYHNTIRVMQDVDRRGAGQCYHIGPAHRLFPHEVFNNIFIQVSDHPILVDARVADGSQIHDGNLYFRSATSLTTPLFAKFHDARRSSGFEDLDEFKSSLFSLATKAYYPPGWEASGVEADPGMDSEYRPDPNGPAASGAVDLSGKGWPGLAGETFRGAR